MSSKNWDDDDEAFTEEHLLAIDAIEASYKLSHSSSSSSSSSPTVRATSSGHEHEDPYQIPNIRRQLPRSISSPTACKRFPLSRCRARNFPAMRFCGRILYSKTASEVDKRAMQLLKVLETKRDESGRAIVGLDIEWRPSFRKAPEAKQNQARELGGLSSIKAAVTIRNNGCLCFKGPS